MTDPDDRLGPDHDCRRDDPTYESVGGWYEDHQGRVPIEMAQGLSRYMKERGVSFGEAYRALLDAGAIILLAEEPGSADDAEDVAAHTVTMDLAADGELDGDLDADDES
jgi:hypothetical protein